MENLEVVLSEANGKVGEKAKKLKLSIDFDVNMVNITGESVIITAAGREINSPLSHSQYNNSEEALNSLLNSQTTHLTDQQRASMKSLIKLNSDFIKAIKPILSKYMKDIHSLNNI